MSSWTDKAPTFNPYVQQVPVETMAAVGMQKQQQYDTNVQRITEQIDKIAGLDIVRDIDKTYLQSKLNELGNNLRTFAASDFSNYQLTNSTVGMVNNVAKDKYVINAVNSTAKYRKALERREKIINDGKGSASREWLFNMESNEWLNNNDLNAKYNGDYKPYKDYSKSAQEIVKGLAKDYTENDVYLDSEGNVIDVMTKQKIEGITPEKIQTALKAGLNPDDWEQLQVDGRYKYSNVDEATFLGNIEERYNKSVSEQQSKLDELIRVQKNAASIKEKERLQQKIDEINAGIDVTKKDFENIKDSIDSGNIESAKASLFTNQWMLNFSNAFSSKSVSQTIHKNPAAEMAFERDKQRQEMAFKWATLGEQQRHNLASEDIARGKKKKGDGSGDDDDESKYGPTVFGVSEDDTKLSDKELVERKKDGITNLNDEVETLKKKGLAFYDNSDKQKAVSDYNEDYLEYLKNPTAYVNHKARSAFEARRQKEKLLKAEQLAMGTHLINAETLFPVNYETTKVFEVKDKNGIIIADKNFKLQYEGKEYEYNYLQSLDKIKEFQTLHNKLGTDSESIREKNKYVDKLSLQDRALYENFKKGLYNTGSAYEVNMNIRNLYSTVSNALQERDKQIDEFVASEIRKSEVVDARQSFGLDLTNDETRSQFIEEVIIPTNKLVKEQGGIQDFDKNDANALLLNTQKIKQATVTTNGKDKHSVIVTIPDGGQIEIPIDTERFNRTFRGKYALSPGTMFYNENVLPKLMQTPRMVDRTEEILDANNFQSHEDAIQQGYKLLPNGKYYKETISRPEDAYYTTATDGRVNTTLDNAWFEGTQDFPNVQYYRIGANVVTTENPTDAEELYFDLTFEEPAGLGANRKKVENFSYPKKVLKSNINETLNSITDRDIFYLFNNRYPSNEELQALKEASEMNVTE